MKQNINSSSRSNAIAGVLADFLPAYDKMEEMKAKYAGDEFGSKYGGLSIAETFSKMGQVQLIAKFDRPNLNGHFDGLIRTASLTVRFELKT